MIWLLLNCLILLRLLKSILILLKTFLEIILLFLCIYNLIYFTYSYSNSASSFIANHTYRFAASSVRCSILINLRICDWTVWSISSIILYSGISKQAKKVLLTSWAAIFENSNSFMIFNFLYYYFPYLIYFHFEEDCYSSQPIDLMLEIFIITYLMMLVGLLIVQEMFLN